MYANGYKHRGMFFVKNDAFMGSPATMTITIRTASKFRSWGWSEWSEMICLTHEFIIIRLSASFIIHQDSSSFVIHPWAPRRHPEGTQGTQEAPGVSWRQSVKTILFYCV